MTMLIDFMTFNDSRGDLTVIEKRIPFEIKRIYYIYNCSDQPRGGHRHIKTKQVLVCLSGSCEIYLTNGDESDTVVLNSPAKGLYVAPEFWHSMSKFTSDAILLVLASEYFDPADYIDEPYTQ
jgi:dTDP-4-dehydrorhamnose 3,5-epimerase-like enzyme